MSLGDTLLQLLSRFIVNTVYVAYLPLSHIIIIIIIITIVVVVVVALVFVGVRLNEAAVSCFCH
jgi:hypothetical protein